MLVSSRALQVIHPAANSYSHVCCHSNQSLVKAPCWLSYRALPMAVASTPRKQAAQQPAVAAACCIRLRQLNTQGWVLQTQK